MQMMESRSTEWSLDMLRFSHNLDHKECPCKADVGRLILEFYNYWVDVGEEVDVADPSRVFGYLSSKFRVDDKYTLQHHPNEYQAGRIRGFYDAFEKEHKEQRNVLTLLCRFAVQHNMDYLASGANDDGDEMTYHHRLVEVSRILYSAHAFYHEWGKMLVCLKPNDHTRRTFLNDNLFNIIEMDLSNDPKNSKEGVPNPYTFLKEQNNGFQNAILFLRDILFCLQVRRADDAFFSRVKNDVGVEMMAYEKEMTVEDFVFHNISPEVSFEAWRWSTTPAANGEHLVKYFKTRPLPEAEDLVENHMIRSYSGDAAGRGSVVYCSISDVAFDYELADKWENAARNAELVHHTILGDSKYKCVAPNMSDVCVVHINAPFPYDTQHELETLHHRHTTGGLFLQWRESAEYECRDPTCELQDPVLSRLLHERMPPLVSRLGVTIGKRWKRCHGESFPKGYTHIRLDAVTMSAVQAVDPRNISTLNAPPADVDLGDGNVFIGREIINNDGARAYEYYVPLIDHDMQPRVTFSLEEWNTHRDAGATVSPHSFLRYTPLGIARDWVGGKEKPDCEKKMIDKGGCMARVVSEQTLLSDEDIHITITDEEWYRDTDILDGCYIKVVSPPPESDELFFRPLHSDKVRYFRVDTGRTWLDCEMAEIDHIYDCQRFNQHDKFMLYALKGRTLFKVGEQDKQTVTLFYEGVGGSGKTTVLNAQMCFYPHHRIGILSSNIEAQFGMSQVIKEGNSLLISCNEVASDLNAKQEEWQTSMEGSIGSYAVKHQKPYVGVNNAQHLWAGNSFPKKWKNGQQQVSRRLAGVLLQYPVSPRDGSITERIKAKLGNLQRKEILAYKTWLRCVGTIDVMSVPELLPPAFRSYYKNGLRTDPMEDFFSHDYVKEDPEGSILATEFQILWERYCGEHNVSKLIRFEESLYRTAFHSRSVVTVGKKNERLFRGIRAVETKTTERADFP